MGIIFRKLYRDKNGKERFGTLDPETREPVVNEKLRNDKIAAALVEVHEREHQKQLEGDGDWVPFDIEPLADLAVFDAVDAMGGMPGKSQFNTRMGRELRGEVLELRRLYSEHGGDEPFKLTNGNLMAVSEARKEMDKRFRDIERNGSSLERRG